jgi:hypothetical protein
MNVTKQINDLIIAEPDPWIAQLRVVCEAG